MSFAETVKNIRKKCLLSQSDFAEALHVSFTTINRWEKGKVVPKLRSLKRLEAFCFAHNIPFDAQSYISDTEATKE